MHILESGKRLRQQNVQTPKFQECVFLELRRLRLKEWTSNSIVHSLNSLNAKSEAFKTGKCKAQICILIGACFEVTFDWASSFRLQSSDGRRPTDSLTTLELIHQHQFDHSVEPNSGLAGGPLFYWVPCYGRKEGSYNPHHLRLLWSGSVLDGDKSECSIHGSVRS